MFFSNTQFNADPNISTGSVIRGPTVLPTQKDAISTEVGVILRHAQFLRTHSTNAEPIIGIQTNT